MKLVAVCGNAGVGKDTAANYLMEEHGYVSMSFADPVKEMIGFIFKFSDKQLYGHSDNRNAWDERYTAGADCRAWYDALIEGAVWIEHYAPKLFGREIECQGPEEKLFWAKFSWLKEHHPKLTPRLALQTFGTEWGRALDPDLWTKNLIKRVLASEHPVVVSDTRFKNELFALKRAGAFTFKIRRKEAEELASLIGIQNHVSEAELRSIPDSEFDYVINNNSSLDKFYSDISLIPTIINSKRV